MISVNKWKRIAFFLNLINNNVFNSIVVDVVILSLSFYSIYSFKNKMFFFLVYHLYNRMPEFTFVNLIMNIFDE